MRVSFLTALLAASLLLASCSDDPVRTSSPPADTYKSVSLEFYGGRVGAIGGRTASDVYVAADIFAHYDGSRWDLMELPSRVDGLFAIWPGDANDLFCLDYGIVHRYDGNEWSYTRIPNGMSDYFIAENELILRDWHNHVWISDGTTWSEVDTLPALPPNPYYTDYTALAGTSDHDIYAAASDGSILRYDGNEWNNLREPDGRRISSAWKENGGALYLTVNDTLCTFDGSTMTPIDLGSSFRASRVFGNADADPYVEGYFGGSCRGLRQRTATGWKVLECAEQFSYRVWGAPTGESFMGTVSGLVRVDGDRRDILLGDESYRSSDNAFYDMWGSPTDGIVAIGDRALHYVDGTWNTLGKEELTLDAAYSLWGTSVRDLWAVGDAMILHYDGSRWTWESGANQRSMRGVWSNAHEVIAVGSGGTIIRGRGLEWETMPTGTTYNLHAVWGWEGGAFAAGEAGVLLQYDGKNWDIVDSPINWNILDLYGLSADNIWAVGSSAIEICHFNGREWIPEDVVPLQGDCVSVWASSSRNVFVANSWGGVMHFDGNDWSLLPRYSAYNNCLWGDTNGDLLVASRGILRYHR